MSEEEFQHKNVGIVAAIIASVVLILGLVGVIVNIG